MIFIDTGMKGNAHSAFNKIRKRIGESVDQIYRGLSDMIKALVSD